MPEQIQDSLGDQRKSLLSHYDIDLTAEEKLNPYDFTNPDIKLKISKRIQKTLEVDRISVSNALFLNANGSVD